MSWFESLILGLVQGLTEFLPISSSAHLRLTAVAFDWEDPGPAFTAVTQIGTETAILIYFRKDIVRIIRAWFRSLRDKAARSDPDARMGWLVIVGSIPIGVLGLTLQDAIDGPFRDLRLIAVNLIVLGIILGVADRMALRDATGGKHRAVKPRKTLEQLSVRDGLIYGFAQAMALVPGVSRSGATITGGLFLGYTREAAARYSFLLAIPAVLASGGYELTSIGEEGSHISWGPTILATVVSFLVGFAVIAWFMKWVSTRTFMPFVWYRVVIGVALLLLIFFGVVEPHAGEDVGTGDEITSEE
ncbi:undecaprenyl-diphosphate phosphatase [Streptomyces radicis]|uniref:Undecaprenyl-diphosphatase n=1 Tax=Streptomyces radicis TaxID=1750517 RepID=A0A3A9WI85_9ACTN|nr:undecaprenyl-diphosphate phosphatase [Streptomyces radicis]RKN12540.1 undecaprenyl-diphosphate phosphatase [Streptomyces radicis]RKN27694.1 undecaprenyl-diphosphate phosphatase [Streptomyces radicis]